MKKTFLLLFTLAILGTLTSCQKEETPQENSGLQAENFIKFGMKTYLESKFKIIASNPRSVKIYLNFSETKYLHVEIVNLSLDTPYGIDRFPNGSSTARISFFDDVNDIAGNYFSNENKTGTLLFKEVAGQIVAEISGVVLENNEGKRSSLDARFDWHQ